MEPIFSTSVSEMAGQSSIAEIQLLADQELMGLWEQTQLAAAAIEHQGGSASTAHRYERAVLMEMQKRLSSQSGQTLFGMPKARDAALPEPDALPHIMVLR